MKNRVTHVQKAKYFRLSLLSNRTNYENSYLMALYREYT